MIRTESISANKIKKDWLMVDANGVTLGKLASKISSILMGKHKPGFTKHMDDGDYVVVVNAEKINLTGNKWKDKIYYKHTGYVGHLKKMNYETLLEKKPHFIIEKAIRGMLPKNKLGRQQYKHLFVYAGDNHPHSAQQAKKIEIK